MIGQDGELLPIFVRENELAAVHIAEMRAYWLRPTPRDGEPGARPRDLRFARTGGLDGSSWHQRVAALLEGTLDPDFAPCVRHRDEIRSVRRAEVDWSALEPKERRALYTHGLQESTLVALCEDPAPDPRAAVRAAVGVLLAHVPAGPLAARCDAARDLVHEALVHAALTAAGGSRTQAAATLGVPDERIADALRRYPHLAERWPGRRGRPAR